MLRVTMGVLFAMQTFITAAVGRVKARICWKSAVEMTCLIG